MLDTKVPFIGAMPDSRTRSMLISMLDDRATVVMPPQDNGEDTQATANALMNVSPGSGAANLSAALKLAMMVGRSTTGFEMIIFAFIASPVVFDIAMGNSLHQQLAGFPARIQVIIVSIASKEELGRETSEALETFSNQSKSKSVSLVYLNKLFTSDGEQNDADIDWKLLEQLDELEICGCTSLGDDDSPLYPPLSDSFMVGEETRQPILRTRKSQKLDRQEASCQTSQLLWAAGTCRESSIDRLISRSSTGMLRPCIPTYATLRSQYEEWNLILKEAEARVAEAVWEECQILRYAFPRYRTRLVLRAQVVGEESPSTFGALRIMEDLRVPKNLIFAWSKPELRHQSTPSQVSTQPFDMFKGKTSNKEPQGRKSPPYFEGGWEYWADLDNSRFSLYIVDRRLTRVVVRDERLSRTLMVQVTNSQGAWKKEDTHVIATMLPDERWWRSPFCAFLLGAASFLFFILVDVVLDVISLAFAHRRRKVGAHVRRTAGTVYISSHDHSALYIQQLMNEMLGQTSVSTYSLLEDKECLQFQAKLNA